LVYVILRNIQSILFFTNKLITQECQLSQLMTKQCQIGIRIIDFSLDNIYFLKIKFFYKIFLCTFCTHCIYDAIDTIGMYLQMLKFRATLILLFYFIPFKHKLLKRVS